MTSDPMERMPRRPSQPGPDEKRAEIRLTILRRLAVISAVAACLVLVAAMAWVVFAVRATQVAVAPSITSSEKALDAIQSCTTPGRECYKESTARYKHAVLDFSAIQAVSSAAAAACATHVPANLTPDRRYHLILTCVKNIVDDHQPAPREKP